MAFPGGHCINQKGGGNGRGCQGNRVCIQRPQLLLWKSYQMDHQLPPFSHSDPCLCHRKIFYRAAGGREGSCIVVTTYVQGEKDSEWAWSSVPASPVLRFTQIHLWDLSCAYGWPISCLQTLSQLTFSVFVSKLMMCWNVSLECLQSVLRNAKKSFSHFYNQSKNQAWPARTFLWPWFWFFQAGTPVCFDEIVRKSGFRRKKNPTLSQRQFTYVKHLPCIVSGGGLVIESCPTLVTPWNVAHQAPLSIGFPRQEYWSVLPFPSPRDLPNPGIESSLLHCRRILYELSYQGNP